VERLLVHADGHVKGEAWPPRAAAPGDPQRPARHGPGHRETPGSCGCAATAGACAPATALRLAGSFATGEQAPLACAVCQAAQQTDSHRSHTVSRSSCTWPPRASVWSPAAGKRACTARHRRSARRAARPVLSQSLARRSPGLGVHVEARYVCVIRKHEPALAPAKSNVSVNASSTSR